MPTISRGSTFGAPLLDDVSGERGIAAIVAAATRAASASCKSASPGER